MSDDKLHVIVLNDHGYVNGGASQVAITSLNKLAASVSSLTFVAGTGPVDPMIDLDCVKVVNFDCFDLITNPSKVQASVNGIWNASAASRFDELLTQFNPLHTIIHVHTWTKSLSSSVTRVAISRGFKVVYTLHDYFAACPNGGFYNYNAQKLCSLKPMSVQCVISNCDSRSYSHKLWRLIRQTTQKKFGYVPGKVDAFITVSDYSENLLRPWLQSDANYFRVQNPIDIEKFEPACPESNDAFTFVGRLAPEKGCNLFSEAAKISGVRAVFVGSGEEDATIYETNPNAKITGWLDRAGVIRAIQGSRAIVFPSLWHETLGMVVLEAAALGIPVIVSDACAAKDAVLNHKTGLLFKSGDCNDLAVQLRKLNDDPLLAKRLGRAAYDRYWGSPPTMEKYVRQLVECYSKIMMKERKCA